MGFESLIEVAADVVIGVLSESKNGKELAVSIGIIVVVFGIVGLIIYLV